MTERKIDHLQKGEYPKPEEYGARTKEPVILFEDHVWNSGYQKSVSRDFDCFGYRKFTLFLKVKGNSEGAQLIDFMPQFSAGSGADFHDHAQGLFAALGYHDAVAAVDINECFTGECAGRRMRLRVIETTTSEQAYFTVTARVEFWS